MAEKHDQLLELARSRFALVANAETDIRREALDDLKFYAGEQWPADIERSRNADKRPCLTINRLPQFVHQVTNEIRQNKPSPKVSAVDDQGDVKTAEVIQGIIRHICRHSNADSVRAWAAFYAAVTGRGYYRIVTDYCDPMSFDQDILIRRIKNPHTVYMDPACQEPDASDARFCFVVESLTKDEFKAQHPESEVAGAEDFSSIGDTDPEWVSEDGVRVAEYFYIETKQTDLALLQDGSVVELKNVPEGAVVMRTRKADVPVVMWAKINAVEILDGPHEWPGRWIPVIPVLGEELDIDGRTQLKGMVRNAKDAQRMLNYWESAKTETIALAPRAPYMMAEGQDEGYEGMWQQANTRNFSRLVYKPVTINGELAPSPQRQTFEPPIQAISIALEQSVEHLKATTGVYDASLGNRSNETSGKAILARQQEGDTANYHFVDNLAIAITHETRILIDLIRRIYDRPGRVARIIGEDDTEKQVTLNQPHHDGKTEQLYDVSVGKYDVAISVGPSYATKRQEAAESMMGLVQAMPDVLRVAGDLIVKNMDWPGAQEISDRLKKTLQPGLAEDDGQQQVPPQVQAQLQQSAQMIEQLTEQLNTVTEEIRVKKFEIDSKERIESERLQVQREEIQSRLAIEMARIGSTEAIKQLQEELAAIRHQMDLEQQARAEAQALEQQEREMQQQPQGEEMPEPPAEELPLAA